MAHKREMAHKRAPEQVHSIERKPKAVAAITYNIHTQIYHHQPDLTRNRRNDLSILRAFSERRQYCFSRL